MYLMPFKLLMTLLIHPYVSGDDSFLDVARRAVSIEDSNLDISFTSPYPVGHYTVNFGKKLREDEKVEGVKVLVGNVILDLL